MLNNQETATECTGCRYRRPLASSVPSETACHYLLDTGHPRGCPARVCTRWQPFEGRPGWERLLHVITIQKGGEAK